MAEWNYQHEENKGTIAEGDRRCVIVAAEESVSKSSGNPMIVITVRPSGSTAKVKSYIVKNDNFNRNMTEFFAAFPAIEEGNFEFIEWIGALGAAKFGADDRGYLKVKWFLSPDKVENLPPFEGEVPERQTVTKLEEIDDESDLPF